MVNETIQRARLFLRLLTFRKLDVFDQLEMDHLRIELLFFRWRWVKDRKRRHALFTAMNKELTFHIHLEESLFYPECEKLPDMKVCIDRFHSEHKEIKGLLREISEHPQKAASRLPVLIEIFRSHSHEEENELFPRMRQLLKKQQVERLSRDLRFAKEQIEENLAA